MSEFNLFAVDKAMGIIKTLVYLATSALPAALSLKVFGASATISMLLLILVHELGHAAVWKLARRRIFIFITPLFGFCMPLDFDEDVLPFSPLGTALLYLSGPMVNILVLAVLTVSISVFPALGQYRMVYELCVFSAILIGLNLLVPCVFLDGWRVLFFAMSGPLWWSRILFLGLSALTIRLMWPVDRYFAISVVVFSILFGIPLTKNAVAEWKCDR